MEDKRDVDRGSVAAWKSLVEAIDFGLIDRGSDPTGSAGYMLAIALAPGVSMQ